MPTPGEAIQAALASRGWTHKDLARVLGRHRPEITSLIQGKRGISAELAVRLAAALGETPEFWLGLDAARQLSAVEEPEADDVRRRARAYELAPITEMERRGWLRPDLTGPELEAELCRFFGVATLDEEPVLDLSARKTKPEVPLTKEQRAWAFRARQIAAALPVGPFDPSRMDSLAERLRRLAAYPEDIPQVPRVLAEHGIRLVVVEPIAGGSIDGAAFWLGSSSPVIALSVRIDRVDAFWFTLCHEVAHIRHQDTSVDANLVGEACVLSGLKEEAERRADDEAATMLVQREAIESFIQRVGPLYSKVRIVQFANRIKIHPGIIVGQLQYRGELKWSACREMLVKVRERILTTAVADGWNRTVGLI